MIFDYITEFAGYLNDRGYAVTQNKISRFLSLKNEETDFTREAEIIPLMKLCFCRNKEEADSFSDYFYQYIKDYKGSYAREKQRIRKEHQEQMEYSKSQKEKTQKEITGVRQGYVDGYLRKSVVKDPIYRENTKDNTPAIIHYSIVPGDRVRITVAPKGFGSENMSRVFMLKPADGIEGVKNAILTAVKDAGPNACPPMVVGVGIGGTFEKCALMAKKALTRPVDEHSEIPYVRELEEELLEKINKTGIGPGGLGGSTTALAVNINTYPTHIAGLPVAVNICCHVNRHAVREI